jgi:hypothetical protein
MKRKKTTLEIPDRLVEGWENAEKAIHENASLLSERTYSLATGGLALSFTIISFIIGQNKIILGWQAPVIWLLFLLCIIADTFSIIWAKHKDVKLEAFLRSKQEKGDKMSAKELNNLIDKTNRPIIILNTVVFICLVFVIIWTAIYCYLLLTKLS